MAPQLGAVLGALLGVLERGRPHEMELALSALHELGESPNDPKTPQMTPKGPKNGPKRPQMAQNRQQWRRGGVTIDHQGALWCHSMFVHRGALFDCP